MILLLLFRIINLELGVVCVVGAGVVVVVVEEDGTVMSLTVF